ncbi:hypothetical protein JCM17960_02820 [Magnetospira thiophila]
MATKPLDRLKYPLVTSTTVDEFLVGDGLRLLFFTGDPERRPEAQDLAVILPELVAELGLDLPVAMIDRADEPELAARFGVLVYPSLVALRGAGVLGVIPRLKDWAVYLHELSALFNPARDAA